MGNFINSCDTLIVIIGGNTNTIENNFQNLNGDPSKDFSIAENFKAGFISPIDANYNTWYIAQSNTNYIENNAYDLGIGLDTIPQICQSNGTTIHHIHIICHSKGGLEVRAMLGGLGRKLDGTYSGFPINSEIESITFLATPQRGLLFGSSYSIAGNAYAELINGSSFLNTLDNSILPSTIRFLNVTGNDPIVWFNFTGQPNDGLVPLWSSQNPILMKGSNSYIVYPNLVQLFVSYNVNRSPSNGYVGLHSTIHHTSILNASLDVCDLSYTNLNRIFKFIRGNVIQNCNVLPNTNTQYIINGSILSGATISVKRSNEIIFSNFCMTDENGIANSSFTEPYKIGDSIKINAAGYEPLVLAIDSNSILTNKIEISMLNSITPTYKIKYPSLKLVNQNPITFNNNITTVVSC